MRSLGLSLYLVRQLITPWVEIVKVIAYTNVLLSVPGKLAYWNISARTAFAAPRQTVNHTLGGNRTSASEYCTLTCKLSPDHLYV